VVGWNQIVLGPLGFMKSSGDVRSCELILIHSTPIVRMRERR
jgi:hypothetical protein